MHKQHHTTPNAKQQRRPGRRRGVLSMELVLTLPVLIILLLGIFEFTCLFFTYGSIAEASRAGARKAALHGVLEEDVYDEVYRSLGGRMYTACEITYEGAVNSGEEVACGIRVPMGACAPNLLWPIGYDLDGQYIQCATRMSKE